MLVASQFCSLKQFERIPRESSTAVISILDAHEERHRPRFTGFRGVLKLTFEDVFEESFGIAPGAWPDELTQALSPMQAASAVAPAWLWAPQLADARAIVDFVANHHQAAEPVRLVVHCLAGISRSCAVARWVGAKLEIPVVEPAHPAGYCTPRPNPRLLRLLDRAWEVRDSARVLQSSGPRLA